MVRLAWVLAVFLGEGPPEERWEVRLPSPRDVELRGPIGEDLARGLERLGRPPYEAPWILADVSFGVKRIFTNYSGDVSGRFLELAALTSPPDRSVPPALELVLGEILRFQKPDGHFGADFDLSRPFERNTTQKLAPLPMFWGNARLLVGLVAAGRERGRKDLLEAARRLGDFYVATAPQMCSPAREADYRATGTYGDSYVCDYFPAIEGLVLLHRATGEKKYLDQARRMADFFRRFDALPIDHSHGNLCAWRSFLMLFEDTGDRAYLDAARSKWEAAVTGGFIWPIGGLGEHWHASYHVTEACSESDWLRFNLDLWRFTGETRYLDMAERVLLNQYRVNQCPNGGFGSRHLEKDASGPFAVRPKVEEWYFCCSFHGPLGLHHLKAYLAASSERGILVNFPLDFEARLPWGGTEWDLKVRVRGEGEAAVSIAPRGGGSPARPRVWMRAVPGEGYRPVPEDGVVRWVPSLSLEGRRFRRVPGGAGRHRDVAILQGSRVLFASGAAGSGRPALLVPVDGAGVPRLPAAGEGFVTVAVPSPEADEAAVAAAVASGPAVLLRPWGAWAAGRRAPFMFDVVAVPASSPAVRGLESAASRLAGDERPVFGEDLERRRDLWPEVPGWTFGAEGLRVTGGDVGLIRAGGYRDYRFEFDLVLPPEGQGISGWLVRARDEENGVLFQLQSADSPFRAPEFKTRPNTLRPHLRRDGAWEILEPVPLPAEVRRGESHRVAVECRGDSVEVFLDGRKVHAMKVPGHREGGVGFRAAGPGEQGVFRRIALRRLD